MTRIFHLETLHEHVSTRSVAEAVPLVLHVLNGHVALTISHVSGPALPGAGGVHVGAVLGHGVSAALLVVVVPAHQVLRVQTFYRLQGHTYIGPNTWVSEHWW